MPAEPPVWLNTHSHEPNPIAPHGDGGFMLEAGALQQPISLDLLQSLPYTEISDCYILSTGHGASGPFTFGGVLVADFLTCCLPAGCSSDAVDFISADGYGTRLDLESIDATHGPLLAWCIDAAPMRREQGLVRLIVPGETDDALHQVKWLACVVVHVHPAL